MNEIKVFLEQDKAAREAVKTVILTGSFATGKATEHSDIDLCYMGDFPDFQRESLIHQGREFQLMMAPWSWYEHVISVYERQDTNIGTITGMLAFGKCLYGDTQDWRELQALAQRSHREGPSLPSSEKIRKIRVGITD